MKRLRSALLVETCSLIIMKLEVIFNWRCWFYSEILDLKIIADYLL